MEGDIGNLLHRMDQSFDHTPRKDHVGLGDVVPETILGQLLIMTYALYGLGLMKILFSTLSSKLKENADSLHKSYSLWSKNDPEDEKNRNSWDGNDSEDEKNRNSWDGQRA